MRHRRRQIQVPGLACNLSCTTSAGLEPSGNPEQAKLGLENERGGACRYQLSMRVPQMQCTHAFTRQCILAFLLHAGLSLLCKSCLPKQESVSLSGAMLANILKLAVYARPQLYSLAGNIHAPHLKVGHIRPFL